MRCTKTEINCFRFCAYFYTELWLVPKKWSCWIRRHANQVSQLHTSRQTLEHHSSLYGATNLPHLTTNWYVPFAFRTTCRHRQDAMTTSNLHLQHFCLVCSNILGILFTPEEAKGQRALHAQPVGNVWHNYIAPTSFHYVMNGHWKVCEGYTAPGVYMVD